MEIPLIVESVETGDIFLFGDQSTATCVWSSKDENIATVWLDGTLEEDFEDESIWKIHKTLTVYYESNK